MRPKHTAVLFLKTSVRYKMRVRISYDQGKTCPISRGFHDWMTTDKAIAQKLGGYSLMTKTNAYCIGALIEMKESGGNYSNEFYKFNLP